MAHQCIKVCSQHNNKPKTQTQICTSVNLCEFLPLVAKKGSYFPYWYELWTEHSSFFFLYVYSISYTVFLNGIFLSFFIIIISDFYSFN